jgi:carbon storage regulator
VHAGVSPIKEDSMLVLTRRMTETIMIDGEIEVTVLAVQGDRVRLGIKAPPHLRVDRLEIHQRRAETDESDAALVAPRG